MSDEPGIRLDRSAQFEMLWTLETAVNVLREEIIGLLSYKPYVSMSGRLAIEVITPLLDTARNRPIALVIQTNIETTLQARREGYSFDPENTTYLSDRGVAFRHVRSATQEFLDIMGISQILREAHITLEASFAQGAELTKSLEHSHTSEDLGRDIVSMMMTISHIHAILSNFSANPAATIRAAQGE
jgi:hypothetical protein